MAKKKLHDPMARVTFPLRMEPRVYAHLVKVAKVQGWSVNRTVCEMIRCDGPQDPANVHDARKIRVGLERWALARQLATARARVDRLTAGGA